MSNRSLTLFSLLTSLVLLVAQVYAQEPNKHKGIAASVIQLHKNSKWEPVETIKLDFKTFHTQGMVKIDDHFYLSAVEVIESTETYAETDAIDDFSITRTAGKGRGWLFKFSNSGKLVSKLELTNGDAYHPGGIDFDGTHIWVPVGEYRPNSKSNIYKIDPLKMTAKLIFSVDDHIGNMVYNPVTENFHGSSWGGCRLYQWKLDEKSEKVSQRWQKNPSHYIDYQDCHYAGAGMMLCGGVQTYRTPDGKFSFGGIELVDISADQVSVRLQLPITNYLPNGLVLSHNPFWAEVQNNKMRFYFMPEKNGQADLHVFDVDLGNNK